MKITVIVESLAGSKPDFYVSTSEEVSSWSGPASLSQEEIAAKAARAALDYCAKFLRGESDRAGAKS